MWITANDLLSIEFLPKTNQGINKRARSENWQRRQKVGIKGRSFEYLVDSLPDNLQAAIRERYYNDILKQKSVDTVSVAATTAKASHVLEIVRQCPAVLDQKTAELTQKQRDIADARMVLVAEVLRLEDSGLSRIKAISFIGDRSRSGDLPEHLQKYVTTANARRGQRTGVSVRALNQWVVDYLKARNSAERLALLAPGHKKAKQPEQVAWVPMFMAHYRNPNGPSVAEAYKEFCAEWHHRYADQPAMCAAVPSVHRCTESWTKCLASCANVVE